MKDTTCPECGKPFARSGLGFHRLYHHQVAVDTTNAEIKSGKIARGAPKTKPKTTTATPGGRNEQADLPPASVRRRGGFFSR
jgi:hypothetical protein